MEKGEDGAERDGEEESERVRRGNEMTQRVNSSLEDGTARVRDHMDPAK